ncbi:MAG: malto-oligosyltrehalose synthase, partial [Tepidisphaeraceae bacterium]
MHKEFTFADARAVSEYLKDLGIGTAYTSPYLAAAAGSMHGYDVIDHSRLNPELRPEAYDAWIASLHDNGLTHVLDIVPNHMGVATNLNRWWNDVLEHGPQAEHGSYFDIAWGRSSRKTLQNKVLMPVLGTSYGDALQAGKLELIEEGGAFYVAHYDRRFPLSPGSVVELFGDEPTLATIAAGYRDLPQTASDRSKIVAQMKSDLKDAIASDPRVGEAVKRRLALFHDDPDRLDQLLTKQHYRLASWRTAADEINYRRFFDVDSLAALAMERPEVFEASHRYVLQLVAEGNVQGLRLDHPDGLYDPAEYFERLQKAYLRAVADQSRGPASATSKRLYVLAEKILAMAEPLPTEWPIDGTTGYDFLVQVNALFVDTEHARAMTDLYQSFTGETCDMEQLSRNCKLLILDRAMSSELSMLAKQLDELAQDRRDTRDFTYLGLRNALREVIASFSVYRTYITASPIADRDRRQVMAAVEQAKHHAPHLDESLLNFIQATLLRTGDATAEQRAAEVRFAGKFQQLTSPVTAKGIEDTAFYRYHRLISLNEVGGEPGRFGLEPDALHAYFADRQERWPLALSTLSTH